MVDYCNNILSYKMEHPIDNSRYERMISRLPPLSAMPKVNKRVSVSGSLVSHCFYISLFTFISLVTYKWSRQEFPYLFKKTNKQYFFEADPYSGKVRCVFVDQPFKFEGF